MEVLQRTKSLRDTTSLVELGAPTPCFCIKRNLKVAIVRMTAIEHCSVGVCDCNPAPMQLVRAGLFPCSPLHPTLAVDMQVLDFAMELFLHLPPNNTAWCNALEAFLGSRGFKLTTKSFARRSRRWRSPPSPPATPRATTPNPSRTVPSTPTGRTVPPRPSPTKRRGRSRSKKRRRDDDSDEEDDEEVPPPSNPFPEPPPLTSVTDYLLERCPLCFGGLQHDPSQLVDVRKNGGRDPPQTHPRSLFVAESLANQMGAHVDEVRPSKKLALVRKQRRKEEEEEEDNYEDPKLKVPRSVLDGCQSSFKAADEKREKASTKFFDDTGIMGLLCRHDRVLWLVNMRTAGEKQYYVLLLLEMLFQHLPPNIRVGVLYDIACQLHRSCVKFGFLDRYMDRIRFAVSVFHAFGHQWPCQIIYHPLKCAGFGFTNGEGCERFWHSISKLIGYLRVSGYHHRLYTIDSQVEHADKASLGRLAQWIVRRTQNCEEKLRQALSDLAESGYAELLLREEWEKQIAAQTKPIKRRSKDQGMAAIEQVLLLRKKAALAFEQVASLKEILQDSDSTAAELLYAEEGVATAEKAWRMAKNRARNLEETLGVNDSEVLRDMLFAEYYSERMNARAVKERLWVRLRDRKFELSVIERSVRRTTSENQRNEHAGAAIKRREPGIAKLSATYNKICAKIASLIATGKAPRGAVAPEPVPTKGLYQLDVDDAIWQNLGLDDEELGSTPPLWLRNEKVKSGIRALLQKDRCEEEAPTLLRERRSLQIWFAREWKTVEREIAQTADAATRYQFELRRNELLQLCVLWKKSIDQLADVADLPNWGPTPAELLQCQIENVTATWGDGELPADEVADLAGDEDDDGMYEVVAALERAG
ncbi:hypothetical protein C8R43DRAFT_1091017 [Mycena crocata]|nr:hypothetical protein C8R43DRAFT_1091017 [Mycena crocata]